MKLLKAFEAEFGRIMGICSEHVVVVVLNTDLHDA